MGRGVCDNQEDLMRLMTSYHSSDKPMTRLLRCNQPACCHACFKLTWGGPGALGQPNNRTCTSTEAVASQTTNLHFKLRLALHAVLPAAG
jgi:hypothetical protein